MPKSATTYRKLAYKLWLELKAQKKQVREKERTIRSLQATGRRLNRALFRRSEQRQSLQDRFKKWADQFSTEILHGPPPYKATARRSTAAVDDLPSFRGSPDSSEFESPESDIDSVDLAHQQQQKQWMSKDSPSSPDANSDQETQACNIHKFEEECW